MFFFLKTQAIFSNALYTILGRLGVLLPDIFNHFNSSRAIEAYRIQSVAGNKLNDKKNTKTGFKETEYTN